MAFNQKRANVEELHVLVQYIKDRIITFKDIDKKMESNDLAKIKVLK